MGAGHAARPYLLLWAILCSSLQWGTCSRDDPAGGWAGAWHGQGLQWGHQRGLAAAASAPELAYVEAVLDLFGPALVPFTNADRTILLQQLDRAMPSVDLADINLMTVEEDLPLTGRASESLASIQAQALAVPGSMQGQGPAPAPGPRPAQPPTPTTRHAPPPRAAKEAAHAIALTAPLPAGRRARALLQPPEGDADGDVAVGAAAATAPAAGAPVAGGGNATGGASEPRVRVRVTVRFHSQKADPSVVERDLVVAATTDLVLRFRAAGLAVQSLGVVSISPQNVPDNTGAAPVQGPPPLLAAAPPPPRNETAAGGATFSAPQLGIVVGLVAPALLGAGVIAACVLRRRRAEQPGHGVEQGAGPQKAGPAAVGAPDPWPSSPKDGALVPPEPSGPAVLEGGTLPTGPHEQRVAPGQADQALADMGPRVSENFPASRPSGDAVLEGSDAPDPGWCAGSHSQVIPFKELRLSHVIGEGSYGKVFLGQWRETTVAIKLLAQSLVTPASPLLLPDQCAEPCSARAWESRRDKALRSLQKEARLMAALRHPCIVQFLGVCLEPPCMVTQFCARGSLLDVLQRARASPAAAGELGWGRRLGMALEAAKGVLYLHSRAPPVLHRDLKSANLLVDRYWHVRLADFNLAAALPSSHAASSAAATNPRWMAPEVLAGQEFTPAADVFSLGVILWELLTWQIPWEECGPWQVVIAVVDHCLRPDIPAPGALPQPLLRRHGAYLDLIQRCWATAPASRPSLEAIIAALRVLIEAEAAGT